MRNWISKFINDIIDAENTINEVKQLDLQSQQKAVFMLAILKIIVALFVMIANLDHLYVIYAAIINILLQIMTLYFLHNNKNFHAKLLMLINTFIFPIMLIAVHHSLVAIIYISFIPFTVFLINKSWLIFRVMLIFCLIMNFISIDLVKTIFIGITVEQEYQIMMAEIGSYLFLIQNTIVAYAVLCNYQNLEGKLMEAISSLAKSNVDLINSNKNLESALKSKDLFIAGLSHEVRNPLNPILGGIEILLGQIIDPELVIILKNAKMCGQVLLNMLNNLLDAAKLNSDKLEIVPFDIDIKDTIAKAIIVQKDKIDQKELQFHVFIDKKLPNMLVIDSDRLLQILINLLANATKFTEQNGKINFFVTVVSSLQDIMKPSNIPQLGCMYNRTIMQIESSKYEENEPEEQKKISTIQNNKNKTSKEYDDFDSSDESLLQSKTINITKLLTFSNYNEHKSNQISNYNIIHIHIWNYDNNNLLDKFHFTNESQEVNLKDQEYLKFEIHDDGCGVDKANIHKMFQMFSQADSTITRKYGGTGLGLWTCKQLCLKMSGDIQIYSEMNKGCSFVFYFPLVRSLQKSITEKNNIPSTVENIIHPIRALLVDDMPFNNEMHKAMMQKLNIECTIATEGKNALKIFCEKPQYYFDFIFMDLQMPEMDGKTICKLIREFEKENQRISVDIYIVSGN